MLIASQLRRRRELAPAGRSYRELGVRKPWYGLVRHADVAGRGAGAARLDHADGIAQLEADPRYAALAPDLRAGLRSWPDNGYLEARGFFDPSAVAEVNSDVDRLSGSGSIREHVRAPRFMNIHRQSPAAANLAKDPRLLELLELIFGRSAQLFQTISFLRGSQQAAHSDAFHMMTEPPGFLIGAWIALEDVDDGSGPVFYLPGTHRLPYVMSEDLDLPREGRLLVPDKGPAYVRRIREVAAGAGVEERRFTAEAGDLLLWHHNLLHGGSAIDRPGSTRRSLVGHYFAQGVLCYHEVAERPALLAVD